MGIRNSREPRWLVLRTGAPQVIYTCGFSFQTISANSIDAIDAPIQKTNALSIGGDAIYDGFRLLNQIAAAPVLRRSSRV